MRDDIEAWQEGIGDMPPEVFERWGEDVVRWIADYLGHPDQFPVLSRAEPNALAAALPSWVPDEPEPMEHILADFTQLILPGITHWNHPRFFAYFAISASAPGILAEMLAAALNVNAMLWRTSPAATELETVTLDWLRRLLGLPDPFFGIIYDTASISTLVAIATARQAALPEVRVSGLAGAPPLRLYCSEQAHSSVEKAAITLGLGQAGVRKIPTDNAYRLDAAALRAAIAEDRAGGWRPFCVVATVGTTSTTSVDPVPAIADICAEHELWLHVDAAYGGVPAILPEKRWALEGVERADSLVVNPHKWLFTPIDLSAFYTRHPETVREAFSLVPAYLASAEQAVNYMDYGPQLGRRFRALKLWFILRAYGRAGIERRLREHLRLAALFACWVREAPDWELMAPVPFGTVCFRYAPPAGHDLDRLNEDLLTEVNAAGDVFLSHTILRDMYALRLSIGNIRTVEDDVRRAWESLLVAVATVRPRDAR